MYFFTTFCLCACRKPEKPPNSAGACRICRKSFKPDDFFRTCHECQNKVCEDCASYSNTTDSEDQVNFQ